MTAVVALVTVAGFVAWDRRSPASAAPDHRLVRAGAVLTGVGAVMSVLAWWLVVPVIVALAGATMGVVGRHRVVSS